MKLREWFWKRSWPWYARSRSWSSWYFLAFDLYSSILSPSPRAIPASFAGSGSIAMAGSRFGCGRWPTSSAASGSAFFGRGGRGSLFSAGFFFRGAAFSGESPASSAICRSSRRRRRSPGASSSVSRKPSALFARLGGPRPMARSVSWPSRDTDVLRSVSGAEVARASASGARVAGGPSAGSGHPGGALASQARPAAILPPPSPPSSGQNIKNTEGNTGP